jgi:hypothetical protein
MKNENEKCGKLLGDNENVRAILVAQPATNTISKL